MSKAILIIDKPESCHICPLFSSPYSDMTCRVNGKTINYPYPDDRVQEWCPLKKVPDKYLKELSEQIEIDKEKIYKKCQRKTKNEKDNVGEDAMILALAGKE